MGFNPDADPATFGVAAPAAPAGRFNPDADPTTFGTPAPAAEPTKEEPSLLEAGLRGARSGVTFGFGDEIAGYLDHALTGRSYEVARDEARARDKAARAAHPIGYGLSEILGGAATTLAAPEITALKGAGFAAAAARGAGAGILTGAGESEANDVQGVAQDAAKGGLVGGALGGILGVATDKLVRGAAGRADKQLLTDIGDRATKTTRDRIASKGESAIDTARQFKLDEVAKKPAELAERTTAAKDKVGSAIGSIYESADAKSPGIPLKAVKDRLSALEADYRRNPATRPIADTVKRQIEDVESAWGQMSHVPSAQVNEFASSLGDVGFAGASLDPKVSKIVQRKAWGAMKDLLSEHVENVAPGQAATLKGLNKQYSALVDIGKAADYRSRLEKFSPTGLRDIAGKGVNAAALAASVATMNPLPILTTAVGKPLVKAGMKATTAALAKLSRAAKAGNGVAAAAQEALAAGVPRGTVEATVSRFGAPQAEATE